LHKIIKIVPRDGYRLEVEFEDGVRGLADFSHLVGKGVFTLWSDPEVFRKVTIGTRGELLWDDAIDICPDSVYMKVTGKSASEIFPSLQTANSDA